ncbi:hypothetical protein GQ457_11G029120 [Hibiscus cannabinus]
MSEMRGRRSGCARGQPMRFSDLIDDTTVDPLVPNAPPATSNPSIVDDHVAPSGQLAPVDPPSVRAAGITSKVPISQTMINNGIKIFSGSLIAAPTEAESWLYDTKRRMDQYGTGLVSTEKEKCEKFLEGLRIGIHDRVATHHDEVFEDLVNRAKTAEELEILATSQSSQERNWFRGKDRDRDRSGRSHTQGDSYGPVASRGDSSGFSPIPVCEQCGKLHQGECKKMKGVCFRFGPPGNFQRDCTRTSFPGQAMTQTHVHSQTPARS